jgi:hypothetical protein
VKFLALSLTAILAASTTLAAAKPGTATRKKAKSQPAKEPTVQLPPALWLDDPATITPPLTVELPLAAEIAEDLKQLPQVPEKFLPAYFEKRPQSYLVDPQALLTPTDSRARLAFLDYHASDSTIDLFVYVFAGNQEIPSEIRDEEVMERLFATGRPAALVFYHLGAPQRSAIYLSPVLTDTVSPTEQRQMLEKSVMQACEMTAPAEQFEKFLVQASIRIYWLERLISGEPATAQTLPSTTPLGASSKRRVVSSARFQHLQALAVPYALPAAGLLGAGLITYLFSHWLRRRASYRFPEFEIEPRLGGSHAAGIGAVISFASAAVPPASQRAQVPDYLRRA